VRCACCPCLVWLGRAVEHLLYWACTERSVVPKWRRVVRKEKGFENGERTTVDFLDICVHRTGLEIGWNGQMKKKRNTHFVRFPSPMARVLRTFTFLRQWKWSLGSFSAKANLPWAAAPWFLWSPILNSISGSCNILVQSLGNNLLALFLQCGGVQWRNQEEIVVYGAFNEVHRKSWVVAVVALTPRYLIMRLAHSQIVHSHWQK